MSNTNPQQSPHRAADIIVNASRTHVEPAIERLRGATPSKSVLSVDQVMALTEGINLGLSPADIAADIGISTSAVVDLAAEFGTWLVHVHGKADISWATEATLFTDDTFSDGTSITVCREFPQSWAPEVLGRNIVPSLAAFYTHNPSLDEVARYVTRREKSRADTVVTFETVAAVAFFARHGRVDGLSAVNPDDHGLAGVLVDAYDLIEVARRDAVEALLTVIGAAQGDIADAAAVASAVFGPALGPLQRAVEIGDRRLIEKEQQFFADRVATQPALYAPSWINDLTIAHIVRIASAAGLDTERDRPAEAAARKLLADLGMSAEEDLYLPEATRAVLDGTEREFADQMKRV